MFADKNRNVQLTGEAYFNVAKNEIIPLHVNCGEINIKVHGTKFNVTICKENRYIDVVLEKG